MRHGDWWRVLEDDALDAVRDLHRECDEDPTDREASVRDAYVHEDYTRLVDLRDRYRRRLARAREAAR